MATRQYIGARYVPIFFEGVNGSEWMSNTAYEPLTIVTRNGNSYTSKKNVPASVGEPENNPVYWASTGLFNSQINAIYQRLSDIENYSPIIDELEKKSENVKVYNVLDYGIVNDGSDVYSKLFDLMWTVHNNGGGVVYFPKGRYTISYTIIIPPNTTVCGDGPASVIYYDESDTYIGVGLLNGGNNVTIRDLKLSQNTHGTYATSGALPGCAAFGDYDFTAYTQKYMHEVHTLPNGVKNLIARNLWFDGIYALQIEPANYCENVTYENIYARDSLISVSPTRDTGATQINGVFIDNVICDCIRFGIGDRTTRAITVNNLNTRLIMAKADNIVFNNVTIDNTVARKATHSPVAVVIAGNNLAFNNVVAHKSDNVTINYVFQILGGPYENIAFSNFFTEGYPNTGTDFVNIAFKIKNCAFPKNPYPHIGLTYSEGVQPVSSQYPLRMHCDGTTIHIIGTLTLGSSTTLATLNAATKSIATTEVCVGNAILSNESGSNVSLALLRKNANGEIEYMRASTSSASFDRITIDLMIPLK